MELIKQEEKKYWKTAIKLAIPALAESVFVSLTAIIDILMVSNLGEYAVAAIGLTTQPKFLGWTIFMGLSISLSALVARRKGEDNKEAANETLVTSVVLTIIFSIIISIISVAFSDPIMKICGSTSETHDAAKGYFNIVMGGMIFNMILFMINAAQRGTGNTKIAFEANFASSIVNIFLNYLLIEGHLGFPALGVEGAAIATVIGTAVGCFVSFKTLLNSESYVNLEYIKENKIRPTMRATKSLFKLATNIIVENLGMRIGFVTTALIAARLGTAQFAAHNVGMNLMSMGFALADGMQASAITLAGQALGKGEKELAMKYGRICQRIGLILSIIYSIILIFFSKPIYKLFFDDPKTISYGLEISKFLMIIVLLQISQFIYGACLRAGGDVKFTLIASIISVTIIRTLLTIITTKVLGLGLKGIWIGVLSDQLTRFILMRWRFKQGKWVEIKI